MNKQGYVQNGSICFLLNRFSIEKKEIRIPCIFNSTRARTQWWRGSGPPGLSLMDSLKPLSFSFSILAFSTFSASLIIRPRLLPSSFTKRCCNGRDADDHDNEETQIKNNKHIKNLKLAMCYVLRCLYVLCINEVRFSSSAWDIYIENGVGIMNLNGMINFLLYIIK